MARKQRDDLGLDSMKYGNEAGPGMIMIMRLCGTPAARAPRAPEGGSLALRTHL